MRAYAPACTPQLILVYVRVPFLFTFECREDALRLPVHTPQADWSLLYLRRCGTTAQPINTRVHAPVCACTQPAFRLQLLRIGCGLRHSIIPVPHKHPYLILKDHLSATAIVNHFHAQIYRQGIHLTHGFIIRHDISFSGNIRFNLGINMFNFILNKYL